MQTNEEPRRELVFPRCDCNRVFPRKMDLLQRP